MKFVKLALIFSLLFSIQSQAGIFNWLLKHDNTITAAIPATITGGLTYAFTTALESEFDIFPNISATIKERVKKNIFFPPSVWCLLVGITTFAVIKRYLGPDKESE